MDLLAAYGDEGDDAPAQAAPPVRLLDVRVTAAPPVDTTGLVLRDNRAVPLGDALHLAPAGARVARHNLPAEQMYAPVLGPARAGDRGAAALPAAARNNWAGHAEGAHLSAYAFDEQYNAFQCAGAAADPGGAGGVVSRAGAAGLNAAPPLPKRQKTGAAAKAARAAPPPAADPTAPFTLTSRAPWAGKEAYAPEPPTEAQAAAAAAAAEAKAAREAAKAAREAGGAAAPAAAAAAGAASVFHGRAAEDYQGRSWVEPPAAARPADGACFPPKRLVHTWSGHTKGVAAVKLFPGTGHLLLSAGLDGAVKVWDAATHRRVMRTYLGHGGKGVRDAVFSPDGRRIATAGYDKGIRLWDTETGAALASLGGGGYGVAYCVRFHPDDGGVLLAGTHSKKVVQFDLAQAGEAGGGAAVQEYDYHLGPVNSVAFIDGNRRFVSTSDDKTIRVWEFGIPVQAQYIADPSMHAISATAVSPSGKWWLGQSADNQLLTYSAGDKVRANRKKTFHGHNVAGYACAPCFSHDGRYVASGDGEGKLFVWDWKTARIARSLRAHDGACVGAEWAPGAASQVVTCGWDGLIKLWD